MQGKEQFQNFIFVIPITYLLTDESTKVGDCTLLEEEKSGSKHVMNLLAQM